MNKSNWISCKEKYPDVELMSDHGFRRLYKSISLVLAQTQYGEIFVCRYANSIEVQSGEVTHIWLLNGGKKLKSKVIAWMNLPEKYEEE